MFIEKILEILGASPFILAILIAFWKGDDAIGEELKSDLSHRLRFAATPNLKNYSVIVANTYDKVFGKKYISERFFLISLAISTILFIPILHSFLFANNDDRFLDFRFGVLIVLALFFNGISDYFANIETRVVVKKWEGAKISGFTALVTDFLLTFFIFFIWMEILFYLIIDQYSQFGYSLLQIYREKSAPYPFVQASLVTTFSTSVWIWLLILFSSAPVASDRYFLGRLLEYALPISDRPIRSIGVIAAVFTGVVYLLSRVGSVL